MFGAGGTQSASVDAGGKIMSILTAEQQEIKKTTREFVAKHIIPNAAEYDKKGEFHPFLLEAARESKIFAMAIPKKYGGLDYSALTQAVALEEWGYGCAGMGTTLAASILGMDPLLVVGNEEQRQRYFEPIVKGEIAAFGLTEPAAGSDAAGGKTTAVRSGDEYVLNGSKCFITNGGYASVFVILAKTDPTKGVKGISAFIVEKGRSGFTVGAVDHKLGIRSSNTVELLLKDVHIPASNLLGKEGEGMKVAMMTLDIARPAIAALAVGIAQRALDECVKYLQKRFPDKLQPGQTLQFKLADMQIQVEAAREALHHTAQLRDSGAPFSEESAIAKAFCGDVAMAVTTQAVSLMGSYGYTSEIAKLMRDAKIMQIYEGTNQIQRLVISRAVLSPVQASASAQKAGK
jgi:alkylation response protein AidB-like acyl-CoA dehydrogenase